MKRFFRLTALAVLALILFAGCKQDVGSGINFSPAVNGIPSNFVGTWENDTDGWHSEYAFTESKISDSMAGCIFNVVSTDTVTSSDGYTLIFTQCYSGTQYTPTGNYYAIAVKLSGNNLLISCPIDYTDTNKSLDQLMSKYSSDYSVEGNRNWTSECTLKTTTPPLKTPVTITDTTYNSCYVKFESNKVSLYQMGNSGSLVEYTYATFEPTRDTSKETGNTLLYLYSNTGRSLVGDMLYVKITKSGSENKIYYYLYDDEEEDNDYMVDSCNSFLPSVSDADLNKIKNLYN